jgi:hypothetical protein
MTSLGVSDVQVSDYISRELIYCYTLLKKWGLLLLRTELTFQSLAITLCAIRLNIQELYILLTLL